MTKEKIECVLLAYNKENFLLPVVVIAEILSLRKYDAQSGFEFFLGTFLWRGLSLPLLTFNLSSLKEDIHLPKVAIINALFSANVPYHPFFAVLFEGSPNKMTVKQEDLAWIDEEKRVGMLTTSQGNNLSVSLPDIHQLSTEVEKLLVKQGVNHISKNAQND